MANGKLYVGGKFTSVLGKPHSNVAAMYVSSVGVEGAALEGVALRAQPNPASGTQVLTFTLPVRGPVRVEVFNVAGRLVRTLGGEFEAGTHSVQWDGRDLAGAPVGPGLYFARLGTKTTKLLRVD
jgi:flagellar hook assembly protein FlgD